MMLTRRKPSLAIVPADSPDAAILAGKRAYLASLNEYPQAE